MRGNTDITGTLIEEHRLILRMLDVLERNATLTGTGSFRDYRFYLDAVDFIRSFADRFHHAKEENVLFEALLANGMPREHSPVAAMLMEHDQGRKFVRALECAAHKALAGDRGQDAIIVANAFGYLQLLREHIAKEDQVLYPLAERLLPEAARPAIVAAYAAAEAGTPADFARRYIELVVRYEAAMEALVA